MNGIVKFLITLALLAALVFCGVVAWIASKVVYADVAAPSRGPVAEAIEATGVITARNVSYVVAKANLDIKAVRFRAGDYVAAGEPIVSATVDYDSVNSQIDGIRAQISGVTARLEQAESDLEKLGALYGDGAVSESAYEGALTLRKELAAQLETLRYQIDSLENSKQEENTAAPVSGVITEVFVAEGDTAAAGSPLAEITDMGDIYLAAELTLEDGKAVSVGDRVVVSSLEGFDGEVAKILPKVSQVMSQGTAKKRMAVEISFDAGIMKSSSAMLVIGDEYDIRIVTNEKNDAFRVPRDTVFLMSQKYYVYVAEDGRARLREVALGLRGLDFYEVESGVDEAGRLVVSPGNLGLSDGALVRYEGDGLGSAVGFVLAYGF